VHLPVRNRQLLHLHGGWLEDEIMVRGLAGSDRDRGLCGLVPDEGRSNLLGAFGYRRQMIRAGTIGQGSECGPHDEDLRVSQGAAVPVSHMTRHPASFRFFESWTGGAGGY
jgi:hypothetical protein